MSHGLVRVTQTAFSFSIFYYLIFFSFLHDGVSCGPTVLTSVNSFVLFCRHYCRPHQQENRFWQWMSTLHPSPPPTMTMTKTATTVHWAFAVDARLPFSYLLLLHWVAHMRLHLLLCRDVSSFLFFLSSSWCRWISALISHEIHNCPSSQIINEDQTNGHEQLHETLWISHKKLLIGIKNEMRPPPIK